MTYGIVIISGLTTCILKYFFLFDYEVYIVLFLFMIHCLLLINSIDRLSRMYALILIMQLCAFRD